MRNLSTRCSAAVPVPHATSGLSRSSTASGLAVLRVFLERETSGTPGEFLSLFPNLSRMKISTLMTLGMCFLPQDSLVLKAPYSAPTSPAPELFTQPLVSVSELPMSREFSPPDYFRLASGHHSHNTSGRWKCVVSSFFPSCALILLYIYFNTALQIIFFRQKQPHRDTCAYFYW